MNWPTRTSVLFIFSLFALFSCDDSNDLSLEGVGSDIELATSYKDDFTVEASTVLLPDSILAYRRGNLLAGQISDSNFGTTTATTFLEVGVGPATFTAATGAQIDSMVLALDYNEAYGDTTQDLTINVHRLQARFQETETYYTFKSLPYEPAPVGSVTFKPTPLGPAYVPVNGTAKTRFPTPVRIRLNDALAAQFLGLSGNSALASQEAFVSAFPGIALAAGPNAKSVIGFNAASDSTYLKIYYKSGGTKYQYRFSITTANNYFSNISTNRTGTLLAALTRAGDSLPASSTNNQVFLQESTGLKTKLTFPDIKSLRQNLGDVAINRAELVIPATAIPYNVVSPYIYLYETDKNNRILRVASSSNLPRALSDGNSYAFNYSAPAPGIYTAKNQEYTINITSYVQSLLYNTMPATVSRANGLLVSPASIAFNSQSQAIDLLSLQTLRQAVLKTAGDKRIMLRVYYTAKK